MQPHWGRIYVRIKNTLHKQKTMAEYKLQMSGAEH